MEISEKELAIIREISNNAVSDQRAIALRSGISLGMTNLIIKRLITKGHVKAKQLDKKKIHYLLTPQGFAEKAKKSYAFTRRTIGLFKTTKEKIKELILSEHQKGANQFIIEGNTDLSDIAESAFRALARPDIHFLRRDDLHADSSVLLSFNTAQTYKTSIDLLSYLSDSGVLF